VTRLRQAHLLAGWFAVGILLLTGAFMRTHFPGAYAGNEAIRYLYRASHLYILFAGLVHLAFGSALVVSAGGWRRGTQAGASLLLFLGLPILLWAFFVEPPRGLPKRPRTLAGVVSLLAGTVLHVAARPRTEAR
jgi:hypothetical protein